MSALNQKTKGILCILTSAFFFALMNTFVRMAGDLPSIQKSFFRNLVAVCFAAVLLLKDRKPEPLDREKLGWLTLRSVFGTAGILCNYYAVDHLVLADATMLGKISPFAAILFSWLLLRERIAPVQGLAVAAAFCGCLLIVKPTGLGLEALPAAVGLLGGVSAGAAYTIVRILGLKGVRGPFIIFFFSAFSCLVTLPALLFDFHPMTAAQLGALLLAGLTAACAQFAVTAAYRYAPAKELSVYDYAQVIFAAILGFLLFRQVPDPLSWAGYAIIFATAVGMFFYNNRSSQKPAGK